jgi:hypothetical protein
MSDIIYGIVEAYGKELDSQSLARIRRYLEILESAGRNDDLTRYGLAYLEQLHSPDPRFTGC